MKRRPVRGSAAATVAVAGLVCAGCPENGDPNARAPILSAPLFREPRDDEERANQAAVLDRLVGLNLGIAPNPCSVDSLREACSGSFSPGGRVAKSQSFPPAVTTYEWNGDASAMVPVLQSAMPESLWYCSYNEDPNYPTIQRGLSPGQWLAERWIFFTGLCSSVLFDSHEQTWNVVLGRQYFADRDGLCERSNGVIRTPDGGSYAAPCAVAFNATYIVCRDVITNYRTGESFFDLTAPDSQTNNAANALNARILSPRGERLAVYDREAGGLRIVELTGPKPVVSQFITFPEHDSFGWIGTGWIANDELLLANIQYLGQVRRLGPPAPVVRTLLVDARNGVAYQIDEGELWNAGLFRLSTDPEP